MAKSRSKAASESEDVPTVHVPVAAGGNTEWEPAGCVVVPAADLRVFERYAAWTRAIPRLLTNRAWRRAFSLVLPERFRHVQDLGALAELVALFPFVLTMRPLGYALQEAALAGNSAPFKAIAKALRKHKFLGPATQRAVYEVHAAALDLGSGATRRAAVVKASGGNCEGERQFDRLNKAYGRFVKTSARSYPRVQRVFVEGDAHLRRAHLLHHGAPVEKGAAPALYLSAGEHGVVPRGEVPPGVPFPAPVFSEAFSGGETIPWIAEGATEPDIDKMDLARLEFRVLFPPAVPIAQERGKPRRSRRPAGRR